MVRGGSDVARRLALALTGVALGALLAAGAGRTAVFAQASADEVRLDAEELPISLERIKRRLESLPASDDERNLLRLSYYVEVYGRAPRINVIQDFDIHNGPVPYGAPTHAEMLSAITPREFSTPPVFSVPIAGWSWKGR